MTTFNKFWHGNLGAKHGHSSVKLSRYFVPYLDKTGSSLCYMLECAHLSAKILCQKYANTLKVVIHFDIAL
jgi:hypothetical protein